MLKSGVDKKTVMEWVGHETSTITDRYSHVIPERMEDYLILPEAGFVFLEPVPGRL